MSDLFDPTQNRDILARLDRLTPESAAVWGKMSVGQMLAHCQVPLQVAFGDVKLKRGLIGFLFGGFAKKSLMAPGRFKPNMPTAPEFKVTGVREFASERQKLAALVRRFVEAGPAGLTKEPHPFFGPLMTGEWSLLQWKHLDHHLRQFGV